MSFILLVPKPVLLLAVLSLVAGNVAAQTTPRTPGGRDPAKGATRPEASLVPPPEGAMHEREAQRLFTWLAPFEPLLLPAQLDSMRRAIREHMSEMRLLEDRRRMLAEEVLQTAVAVGTKPEDVQRKTSALGQAVTEYARHQAEIMQAITPTLSADQRKEFRSALDAMFRDGLEPLSFAEPVEVAAPTDLQSLLLGAPGASASTVPSPRPAPTAPSPRPARTAPVPRPAPTAPTTPPPR